MRYSCRQRTEVTLVIAKNKHVADNVDDNKSQWWRQDSNMPASETALFRREASGLRLLACSRSLACQTPPHLPLSFSPLIHLPAFDSLSFTSPITSRHHPPQKASTPSGSQCASHISARNSTGNLHLGDALHQHFRRTLPCERGTLKAGKNGIEHEWRSILVPIALHANLGCFYMHLSWYDSSFETFHPSKSSRTRFNLR